MSPSISQEVLGQTCSLHDVHMYGLSKKTILRESFKTFKGEMYRLPEVYELERRAIFSKHWILVSHGSRYKSTGDFVNYEMAGFNFVVLKNKEGRLVGFHNICRHRAFPVIRKDLGNAKIFSCKYHGWTYDLNGKLIKAPRFTPESVPDFNPGDYPLFPIHTYTDKNGFVYVNLDMKDIPEITWEDQYGQMDQQDVLVDSGIDWDATEYDFTWKKDGEFNWKTMQDNYNECYHCLTAHPSVAKSTCLDTYYVEANMSNGNYVSHFNEPKDQPSRFDETRFKGRSATHVFPIGHFSPNPGTGFMHLMRSCPDGPTRTRQEYDVYRLKLLPSKHFDANRATHLAPSAVNGHASTFAENGLISAVSPSISSPSAAAETEDPFPQILSFYQQITAEDIELCTSVQKNLSRTHTPYTKGPLHPFHEEGVSAFQKMVMRALIRQLDIEDKNKGAAKIEIGGSKQMGRVPRGGEDDCENILRRCSDGVDKTGHIKEGDCVEENGSLTW